MARAVTTATTTQRASRPAKGIIARISEASGCSGLALPGLVAIGLAACAIALGQPAGFNYDEAAVPSYELPQILLRTDGGAVKTAADWRARRAEILELFRDQVYGAAPAAPPDMAFSVLEEDAAALGGLAHRKQVRVDFGDAAGVSSMQVLLYTPARGRRPGSGLLGPEFRR